jgi:hypothetical protein
LIGEAEPLRITENRIYYMDAYNYIIVGVKPEVAEGWLLQWSGRRAGREVRRVKMKVSP